MDKNKYNIIIWNISLFVAELSGISKTMTGL